MDASLMDGLVSRARGLQTDDRRALLGVVGAPGAAKSTFAAALAKRLRADGFKVALVPMDGFHHSQAELATRGLRHVMGRIDTFDAERYLALLRSLGDRNRTVAAPDFDRTVEEPVADAIQIGPEIELVITEGNYLLDDDPPWPDVRSTLDEVWFVETDESTRVERLLTRHVEFGKTEDEARRWMARVDEPNAFRIRSTRDRADLVVDLD